MDGASELGHFGQKREAQRRRKQSESDCEDFDDEVGDPLFVLEEGKEEERMHTLPVPSPWRDIIHLR